MNGEQKDFLNTNIYEVNLRQYSAEGSIQAFIMHIPRLKDMGVEILWMMPVFPIGIINRKGTLGSYYSIKDFYEVNPEFGSKDDFNTLVKMVHANGMKIIIDWVANHAAWDNNWAITNPGFFVRDEHGNFQSPYDWTDVIQLDHANEEEKAAMLNAMEFWVKEFNIDGFRADLAHLTPLSFWVNARQHLNEIKKGLIWLAETEEINYYEAFDIIYAWKWMHKSEDFLKQHLSVTSLTTLLNEQKQLLPPTARQLYFTSNHDENSWNGTEYDKYGIYAAAFAVFSYTYPGAVPLIYSGQEIPNYRRLQFFEKDNLTWPEKTALHSFYKILASFHKKNFSLEDTRFIECLNNMLAFVCTKDNLSIIVLLNFDQHDVTFNFRDAALEGTYKNAFTDTKIILSETASVSLEPGNYLLLEIQP